MFLDEYHTVDGGDVCITAEQASRFAKEVAGDFNPIHDVNARRFCVPGDLLFALVLGHFGLSQRMTFRFHNMVGQGVPLRFQERDDGMIAVEDNAGKLYLEAERSGESTREETAIEDFTRRYVEFSAHNFPHYLKPLLAEKGVMFNPQRPLVIYDRMSFDLQELNPDEPGLDLAGSSLEVNGKRAVARLEFRMTSGGNTAGTGYKQLVVSGLRPYDPNIMEEIGAAYDRLKADYEFRTARHGE